MAYFQEIYVKIAEATAASKVALESAVDALSDTDDYDGLGSSGNIKTIVDVTTDTFSEATISETLFEIATLVAANSSYTQVTDISSSSSAYTTLVLALNNFVINNVLGKATTSTSSIGGVYQSTLANFLEIDCEWSDSSVGTPAAWVDLCNDAGFSV